MIAGSDGHAAHVGRIGRVSSPQKRVRRIFGHGSWFPRLGLTLGHAKLSHLFAKMIVMEISRNLFVCTWCARRFPRRCPTGRKPHYCSASCRQRAFECRRRGRIIMAHPRPDNSRVSYSRVSFEGARGAHWRIYHALRTEGFPDARGRRQTLCGTWAKAAKPRFDDPVVRLARCRTCQWIAASFPAPTRRFDPPSECSSLRALTTLLRGPLLLGDQAELAQAAAQLLTFVGPPLPTHGDEGTNGQSTAA